VRKQGDRVRIVAELINAADGRTLWSETYDRELKDVFAVQSEIATAVTEQLKIKLLGAPAKSDAAPSNDNLAAYNALQQGTFYFRLSTEEGTRKATEFYGEAIRLDPRYALAYAKLTPPAVNLVTGFGHIATKEKEEAMAKARASAKSALELDPNLSEAHLARALILELLDLNLAGAEAEYRRAIALDPLRGTFHYALSHFLTALGRYDQAEATLRKAIDLQPESAQAYAQLAIIQILRGNPGAAAELAKQETDPFWRTYALALSHFANGDRAEADAALKKLIDEDAGDGGSQIASVYALRKDPNKMFEWLEHAWATHDTGVAELLLDPFMRAYKDDPRFIAFAQKIGVMPKT
jgi:serine/threonine-protein kinase